MTRADFIQLIHDELGPETKASKVTIEQVLKAYTNVTLNTLSEGKDALLFGLGKIKPTKRAERTGRNPRTGDAITIPATVVPKFSANTAVKRAVKSSNNNR